MRGEVCLPSENINEMVRSTLTEFVVGKAAQIEAEREEQMTQCRSEI